MLLAKLRRLLGMESRPRRRYRLTREIEVGIESLECRYLLTNVELTNLVLQEFSGGELTVYMESGEQHSRQLAIGLSGVGSDRAGFTGPRDVLDEDLNHHIEVQTGFFEYTPGNSSRFRTEDHIGTFYLDYTIFAIGEQAVGDDGDHEAGDGVDWVIARWQAEFGATLVIDGDSTPITITAYISYEPLEPGDSDDWDVDLRFDSPEAIEGTGGISMDLHRALVYTTFIKLGGVNLDYGAVFVYPRVYDQRQVVAVVTHGFEPRPPLIYTDAAHAAFMAPFIQIAETLQALPAPGSALDGQVDTYVTQWDSTTSFQTGFVALLSERIFLAKRDLAQLAGNAKAALIYQLTDSALHKVAVATQEKSDRYLELTALSVVEDLTVQNLLNPPGVGYDEQMIELVGHSRGAGVNLRIGQLLWAIGYRNIEYIALDGYGSDWLNGGGILSGVNINAAGFEGKKLNYRASRGLEWDPAVGQLDIIVSDEIFDWVRATNDLRAPLRFDLGALENQTIPASFHTTISTTYGDPSQPYVGQTYVGLNRNFGASAMPLTAGPPLPGFRAEASAPDILQSTELPVVSNRSLVNGFVDGTFDKLADILAEVQGLDLSATDEPELDALIQDLLDPQNLIQLYWQTQGDVRLSQESGDPAIELRVVDDFDLNTIAVTSIAQPVPLPDRAQTLEFDLDVQNRELGGSLGVTYAGKFLGDYYFPDLAETNHISIPLTAVATESGLFEFFFTSNFDNPNLVARLDNFQITVIPNTAPVLVSSDFAFPAATPGAANDGTLVSEFLAGITDLDPNAERGLAIVGVNSSLGTAQYTLDGGATWNDVGPVSDSLALLLAPHYDTRLRVVPNGTVGTIGDAITFRAWDQSNGVSALSGEYFDASVNGGETPISAATNSIGLHVFLDEPPTSNPGGPYQVSVGGSVQLDGSSSSDPDEPAAQLIYHWDLDGDSVFGETGANATRGSEVGMNPTFSATGLTAGTSFNVALQITDSLGLTATAQTSVQISNGNVGAVNLELAGPVPKWIKKQPAINILSQITVSGNNFNGGILLIQVDSPGKKKPLDTLTVPSISSIGTSPGWTFDDGNLELEIRLGPSATSTSIQAFLRGIKFLTKGAGLNKSTRSVFVGLANIQFNPDILTQTVLIQRKPVRAARLHR